MEAANMILLFGANLEIEDVLATGSDEYTVYDDCMGVCTERYGGSWNEGTARILKGGRWKVVCGVTSTPEARVKALRDLYTRLKGLRNWTTPPLRAKSAHVGRRVRLGLGSIVLDHCYVGPEAELMNGAVMLSGSRLCHEARLGACSIMACGAVALGHSKVGHSCLVGANAVVLPYSTIGPQVTMGVGGVAKRMMT
jgi:hypothetical protein